MAKKYSEGWARKEVVAAFVASILLGGILAVDALEFAGYDTSLENSRELTFASLTVGGVAAIITAGLAYQANTFKKEWREKGQ